MPFVAGVARVRRSSGGALAIGRVVGITLAESDADDEEGDDVPPLVTSSDSSESSGDDYDSEEEEEEEEDPVRSRLLAGKKGVSKDAILALASRVWTLDSGASDHVVNSADHDSIVKSFPTRAILDGVSGEELVTEGAKILIPGVPSLEEALKLNKSPNLASMGRLVEEKD